MSRSWIVRSLPGSGRGKQWPLQTVWCLSRWHWGPMSHSSPLHLGRLMCAEVWDPVTPFVGSPFIDFKIRPVSLVLRWDLKLLCLYLTECCLWTISGTFVWTKQPHVTYTHQGWKTHCLPAATVPMALPWQILLIDYSPLSQWAQTQLHSLS